MTQTREGLVIFGLGIVIALMGMAMELDVATYIGGGIIDSSTFPRGQV